MSKTLSKKTVRLTKETAFILLTVIGAVVLPQIFHGLGVWFGVGGKLGQIFLPMYVPILIIGVYRGSISGAIAGLLAPSISFAFTKMPSSTLLPCITLELVATGLFAGVFVKVKMPVILRILSIQVVAKLVRLAAFAIFLYFTKGKVGMAVFNGVLISIPGVLLQLALLTILLMRKERKNA